MSPRGPENWSENESLEKEGFAGGLAEISEEVAVDLDKHEDVYNMAKQLVFRTRKNGLGLAEIESILGDMTNPYLADLLDKAEEFVDGKAKVLRLEERDYAGNGYSDLTFVNEIGRTVDAERVNIAMKWKRVIYPLLEDAAKGFDASVLEEFVLSGHPFVDELSSSISRAGSFQSGQVEKLRRILAGMEKENKRLALKKKIDAILNDTVGAGSMDDRTYDPEVSWDNYPEIKQQEQDEIRSDLIAEEEEELDNLYYLGEETQVQIDEKQYKRLKMITLSALDKLVGKYPDLQNVHGDMTQLMEKLEKMGKLLSKKENKGLIDLDDYEMKHINWDKYHLIGQRHDPENAAAYAVYNDLLLQWGQYLDNLYFGVNGPGNLYDFVPSFFEDYSF